MNHGIYITNAVKTRDVSDEFAVADAVGGVVAVAFFLEFLVVGVGAFVECHLAVALKCKDVGGYAVEKPTVVAYYNGTSGEILKALFKSTQGVDIDVVGGLVEQKNVSLLF